MTTENALEWLEENKFYRWRLFNSTGGKVQDYDPESANENEAEAIEKLAKAFRLMAPGKYCLKGWQGKGRNAAQSEFYFTKPKESNQSTFQQNPMADNESIYQKGFQEAERYLRLEYRIKAIEEIVKEMQEELKDIYKKLTDDDDENDDDAITKLGKMAEMAPNLSAALSAFKSL